MEIRFDGKRALVTGAGKGIGRGIAKRLVACGAMTVALSRTEEDLTSLKEECPEIETCLLDVSDWAKTDEVLRGLGPIDLLVNNAGVITLSPLVDVTEESFDCIFNTNIKGLLKVSQMAARSMIERKSGGVIVNISSVASTIGVNGHSTYAASKGAVDSLTRVMALELAPHGIRTNCINPTIIWTDLAAKVWSDPEKSAGIKSMIPMNRFGEIREVVDTTLYLLSDKASYLNGVSLPVEGGMLIA